MADNQTLFDYCHSGSKLECFMHVRIVPFSSHPHKVLYIIFLYNAPLAPSRTHSGWFNRAGLTAAARYIESSSPCTSALIMGSASVRTRGALKWIRSWGLCNKKLYEGMTALTSMAACSAEERVTDARCSGSSDTNSACAFISPWW